MSAGYTNAETEGTERLSLKDAAEVLQITESGVRARFKRGQIDGERDNSGKIWVFVEPAMKVAVQAAQKPSDESQTEAYRELVRTLHQQIDGLEIERDHLRQQVGGADQLKAKLARIEAEAEAYQERVADLRTQLDRSETERRQLFSAVMEQSARDKEGGSEGRGGFSILGFQIRRKAVRS